MTDCRRRGSCAHETDKLPYDLLIEVLQRLPAKTISRFRWVSKQWFAFITSPSFKHYYIKKKKNRSENSSSSFLLFWDRVIEWNTLKHFIRLRVIDLAMEKNSDGELEFYSEFSFSTPYHNELQFDLYYASSCHGLVCFAHQYSGEVYVVNPITMDRIKLPEPFRRSLILDLVESTNIAIGFLPSTNQFKIVSWYLAFMRSYGCEILTLPTSDEACRQPSWRRKTTCLFSNDYPFAFEICKVSICIQGVIYWLISSLVDNKLAVLAFDLDKEEARFIRARNAFSVLLPVEQHFSFFERGGSLCIVRRENMYIDAWILIKEDSKSESEAYRWIQHFRNIQESDYLISNRIREREAVVCLLNSELGNIQNYLHLQNKRKTIRIVQMGDDSQDEDHSHLALILGRNKDPAILFSESFIFLNTKYAS